MKIRIFIEAEVPSKDSATLLTEKAAKAAQEAAEICHGTLSKAAWTNRRDRGPKDKSDA